MSKIFVVVRIAAQDPADGDLVWANAEKAFSTEDAARAWMQSRAAVWQETIDGSHCNCERAIHVCDLE